MLDDELLTSRGLDCDEELVVCELLLLALDGVLLDQLLLEFVLELRLGELLELLSSTGPAR